MFNTNIKVRFNHVDAAGLIFYPRYYEMLNQVIEEWFEQNLGYDFKQLREQLNAGVPAVQIDAEFPNASRLGDILQFELGVLSVGNSSIELSISATQNEQERFRAKMVLVCVDVAKEEKITPMPLPDTLRTRINRDLIS